jgi:hypothetical protein
VSSLPSVKDKELMVRVPSVYMLDLLIPEHVLNLNQNVGNYSIYFVPVVHVSPHTNG